MQTRVERNERKPSTTKRMIWMIVAVLLLIGLIVGVKVMMVMRMIAGMKPPPPSVVSTAKATFENWQPALTRSARCARCAAPISRSISRAL